MADKTARDKRLDQLVEVTKGWSAKTQKDLNDRVTQLQKMLKGRNAGQLGASSVSAASQLLVDEIDNFLVG